MRQRQIKISANKLAYNVCVSIMYLLMDRSMSVISNIGPMFSRMESLLSQGIALLLIFMSISYCILQRGRALRHLGVLPIQLLAMLGLLFSTIRNNGSLWRCISIIYPIICMGLMVSLFCNTPEKLKRFIHLMSNMYLVLVAMNLVFTVVAPTKFGNYYYLLSGKNQITHALCTGMMFVLLDYLYFRSNKKKVLLYLGMFVATEGFALSGNGLVGAIIVFIFIFIAPARRFVSRVPFWVGVSLVMILVILIVTGLFGAFLASPLVSGLITKVLHKNLTLTHRTEIWNKLLGMIDGSSFLGKGISDSMNIVSMNQSYLTRASYIGVYSAHNQYLQTMYEGGLLTLAIVFAAAFITGFMIDRRSASKELSLVLKTVLFATMVMMLAEANGLYQLFFLLQFSAVTVSVLGKKNTRIRLT